MKGESKRRLEYVTRLMAALEFASAHYWKLVVEGGRFMVVVGETDYVLEHSWSEPAERELIEFETEVEREQSEEAARKRKEELKQSAKAKLTEEEWRAVGLY